MWVKICGNTNFEDAALATQLGADAVGFVFAHSKRQVTPLEVAEITSQLTADVERVGVFSSRDAEEIVEVSHAAGLTGVQLHQELDEDLIRRLGEKFGGRIQIIQTLHWRVDGQPQDDPASDLVRQLERIAVLRIVDRVLVDSRIGSATGGTGVALDWTAARSAFAAAPKGIRVILAGGLKPENVNRAIAEFVPWGVDVSSGVEVLPRRKDPERLARFIKNARAAAIGK